MAPASRASVLVVEDEEITPELCACLLAGACEVTIATDGRRALSLLGTRDFDVVLVGKCAPLREVHRLLEHASKLGVGVVLTGEAATVKELSTRAELGGPQADAKGTREGARRLPFEPLATPSYREALDRARERASHDYLTALMREEEGNVTHAAQRAGLERESLHRLLRRHGIRSEDFKRR